VAADLEPADLEPVDLELVNPAMRAVAAEKEKRGVVVV
jgi:hypothetical protein